MLKTSEGLPDELTTQTAGKPTVCTATRCREKIFAQTKVVDVSAENAQGGVTKKEGPEPP